MFVDCWVLSNFLLVNFFYACVSSENRVCFERKVFFHWSFCRTWFSQSLEFLGRKIWKYFYFARVLPTTDRTEWNLTSVNFFLDMHLHFSSSLLRHLLFDAFLGWLWPHVSLLNSSAQIFTTRKRRHATFYH